VRTSETTIELGEAALTNVDPTRGFLRVQSGPRSVPRHGFDV
jgi:hypothetical protein